MTRMNVDVPEVKEHESRVVFAADWGPRAHPYVAVAGRGTEGAVQASPEMVSAGNVHRGDTTHAAVPETSNLAYRPWQIPSPLTRARAAEQRARMNEVRLSFLSDPRQEPASSHPCRANRAIRCALGRSRSEVRAERPGTRRALSSGHADTC